ncbi:gem-associated protein 2-like [Tigriopus californicus]|uniref:gem-associated protein 2-like n=1 Tax=Tigriopus californicus TaxID=6832 RepID=UPI0027DA3EF4|nr:gem-associated protein 2-like [Tigriopus californicus]|eukprot:TCALIF_07636-PA protein Name:"Similar to gemin2 Gem-associated protein 2 (Xenopus laevis)" AED:0.35 eAED:0.35 QI:58/1/1/1/0.5/0.33/3/142/295
MAFTHEAGQLEDDFMQRALGPLEGDSSDDADSSLSDTDVNVEAMDGIQFLRRAQKEAKKLPHVVVASNIEELRTKSGQAMQPQFVSRRKTDLPPKYLPNSDWQRKQVADFSDIRTKVSRHFAWLRTQPLDLHPEKINLPSNSDEKGWALFCFGSAFWSELVQAKIADGESEIEEDPLEQPQQTIVSGQSPLTTVFFYLKPRILTAVIEYVASWCELLGGLRPEMALWVYSLLANLEKPLHPDIGSAIRTIAISASQERHKLANENRGLEEISPLTLIICIVSKYFSQGDLADDAK